MKIKNAGPCAKIAGEVALSVRLSVNAKWLEKRKVKELKKYIRRRIRENASEWLAGEGLLVVTD